MTSHDHLDTDRYGTGAPSVHSRAVLALLAGLSLVGHGYLSLVLDTAGRTFDVSMFLAVSGLLFGLSWLAYRRLARTHGDGLAKGVRLVLVVAVALRLIYVFAGLAPGVRLMDLSEDLRGHELVYDPFLLYDNDVWRYLWDGHVHAHGFDPYRDTPRALELAADAGVPEAEALFEDDVWDAIFDRVSFRTHRSVYPPLSQGLFRATHALAPGSVLTWKLIVAAFDVAAVFLLLALLEQLGRHPSAVVLYAWNPLVLEELAGSGHADGVMVTLLLASWLLLVRGAPFRGGAFYAAALSTKLAPLPLAGFLVAWLPMRAWWRAGLAGAGVTSVLAWPYRDGLSSLVSGLRAYGGEWVFNPGAWGLVRWLATSMGDTRPERWAHGVTKVALVVLAAALFGWLWRHRHAPAPGERLVIATALVLAAAVALHPAVMPWYLIWALPFALAVGDRTWWWFGALSLLSYCFYIESQEHVWYLLIEHLGLAVALAWAGWRHRRHLGRLIRSGYARTAENRTRQNGMLAP